MPRVLQKSVFPFFFGCSTAFFIPLFFYYPKEKGEKRRRCFRGQVFQRERSKERKREEVGFHQSLSLSLERERERERSESVEHVLFFLSIIDLFLFPLCF